MAFAAKLTIKFPAKGDYSIWFETSDGKPAGDKIQIEGMQGTDVDVPGDAKKLVVEKADTLAVVNFKPPSVDIGTKDFKYAKSLTVNVQHEGKPVASALVKLKDQDGKRDLLISPDMKGTVAFDRVRLGAVVAAVEYTFEGKKKTAAELHANVEAGQPTTLTVAISDKVVTVGEEKGAPKEAEPSSGFNIGSMITILLALVVGAGGLYAVVRFVQHKRDWVSAKMEAMGVQLPSDPATGDPGAVHTSGFRDDAAPPPPLVPEGACPFCGQPKGPDGSCGCQIGGSVAAVAVATSPRLFAMKGPYSGQPFDLGADPVSVGREPGNTICLENDTSISRRHAQLQRQDRALLVEDLGSTNGTFVNGQKVSGQVTAQPGDTVQFGESMFKYEA